MRLVERMVVRKKAWNGRRAELTHRRARRGCKCWRRRRDRGNLRINRVSGESQLKESDVLTQPKKRRACLHHCRDRQLWKRALVDAPEMATRDHTSSAILFGRVGAGDLWVKARMVSAELGNWRGHLPGSRLESCRGCSLAQEGSGLSGRDEVL